MSDLLTLAERIEGYDPKLSPDNRADELELHRDIVMATGEGSMNPEFERTFVRSLDAAWSLVPDGLHVSQFGEARFMTRSPCFSASIEQWVDEHLEARTPFRCHGVAVKPALALCAAALRALASQPTNTQERG